METMNTQGEQMKNQVKDEFKFETAQRMFELGLPREIWASMLCEAYGLENNLPTNKLEIIQGMIEDQQTTHETLFNTNKGN